MDSEKLKDILDYPSVNLLKAKNRKLIIGFLNDTFKEDRKAISENIILDMLSDYMDKNNVDFSEENNNETQLFETNENKAKNCLRNWTNCGFLTNYPNESGEIYYELSSDSIKTIDWLISLKKSDYIGTESKFSNIFSQLKDLVENSNEDKETRLKILEGKKQEIENQISRIRNGEDIIVYEDYQIISRFEEISKMAKELISDFKEVDDNFKAIIHDIYEKNTDPDLKKGEILTDFFDAFSALKNSSQGKSFYAFWDFMRSTDLQEQLEELVLKLYETIGKRKIKTNDSFIRNMIEYLYASGQKVSKTNEKMAEKLTFILNQKETQKSNITKQLILDIQNSLLKISKSASRPDISLTIEDGIEFNLPFERKLTFSPTENVEYKNKPEVYDSSTDSFESLSKLYKTKMIDKKKLKQNILNVFKTKSQTTLGEIIEMSGGISEGLSEVFAYIGLLQKFQHYVSEGKKESILFDKTNNKIIELPEIIIIR